MKTRKTVVTLTIVVFLSIALQAADKDFWSSKSYTEWSKKEVEKLLRNSPWTKSVHVSSLALGGRSDMSRQRMSGVAPGSGNQGGAAPDVSAPDRTLYISWYARPVREALVRQTMLDDPNVTPEQIKQILSHDPAGYDFIIAGLPARLLRESGTGDSSNLQSETYLIKKNKERIPVASVRQSGTRNRFLILHFSKGAGESLVLEDREITLVTSIEGIRLRASFKLADMVIRGKLEI